MKKVFFKTFGCKTNFVDSQIMISNIKDFEISDNEEKADFIVINSCTVTNNSDSAVRSYITKFQNKKIYFTGCGILKNGKELFSKKMVFGVFGHSKKEDINELLKLENTFFEKGDIDSLDTSIVSDFFGKTRAFIKIQEGCNFDCSFCIIPTVRGNARSQDEDKILEQIKVLSNNGYSEFILTGTNISSYGTDNNHSLIDLIYKISKISNVKRIRIGSLESSSLDNNFLELLKEPFMEKHIHIALQHTSDKVLEIMNRKNRFSNDLELLSKLSNISIGTDFITGHPGESEENWIEALNNFRKLPITHIHTFTYSKRDGTKSATLKEISGKIAKDRAEILKEIVNQNNLTFRKQFKSKLDILIEQKIGDYFLGYDQFYNKNYIKSEKNILGEWVKIDATEI